ncbi:MAG: NADH:ubiquinone reductase (Na(+)-transporting) subunit B [Bacteroidia bacterium]|nr:NADH:ubiquinone reductase (Na(+)-transporting) subunit B [Bacteroidia bacterium]
MKALHNLIEKIKPNFMPGGKFEKMHTAFDAFETFLFVPAHTTSNGVHIRDSIDLKRTMIIVVMSLIPCLLFGMWNTGYQHFKALGLDSSDLMTNFLFGAQKVLPIVVVSYVSGLTVEFIFATLRKHSVNEGFLVSGMLIPLVMPVDVPLWMVAVSTIFAVIFGKEVFGGTGMNIFNPAILARAFLFFAYPKFMSGNKVWVNTESVDGAATVDGFTGETPLADAINGGVDAIPSFMDSFLGFIPGSIGETSVVAILIGAAILLYTGIGSWKIMFSCLLGGITMAGIFNLLGLNPFMEVPIQNQLVIGSFMFALVFMATDPVSATQTDTGKYIYGFLIGFLGIMIRVFNPAYPEGMMLAILFMNVMAPLIDHYVYEANIKRRLKRATA